MKVVTEMVKEMGFAVTIKNGSKLKKSNGFCSDLRSDAEKKRMMFVAIARNYSGCGQMVLMEIRSRTTRY